VYKVRDVGYLFFHGYQSILSESNGYSVFGPFGGSLEMASDLVVLSQGTGTMPMCFLTQRCNWLQLGYEQRRGTLGSRRGKRQKDRDRRRKEKDKERGGKKAGGEGEKYPALRQKPGLD
jgi:hypothetical protein